MAKSETKSPEIEDIFNQPLSTAAKKTILGSIEKNDDKINSLQNGLEKSDISRTKEQEQIASSVNTSINSLYDKLTPVGGNSSDVTNNELDGMLMLSKSQYDVERKATRNGELTKKAKKELETLKNNVSIANKAHLENLISVHKSKMMDSIATYNLIIRIIPKMRLALNTYAISILSPDDFTKNNLTVLLNQDNIDPIDKTRIIDRTTQLLDKYNINKYVKNDILQYLITGHMYYYVSTVNKELVKMLNEEQNSLENGLYSTFDDSYLTEVIKESLQEHKQPKDTRKVFKNSKTAILKEFAEVFNLDINKPEVIDEAAARVDDFFENEIILADSHVLAELEDDVTLEENFSFTSRNGGRDHYMRINKADQKYEDDESGDAVIDNTVVTDRDIKGISKAVVRRISAANIVPLNFQDKNYGYIHLDIVEIDPDNDVLPIDNVNTSQGDFGSGFNPSASNVGMNSGLIYGMVSAGKDVPGVKEDNFSSANGASGRSGAEHPTEAGGLNGVEDARLKFMANVFANKLSKKMNLKLIKKNDVLKNAIYNGLAIKKLASNQRLRVVYLRPEEVVHITRGHSIFDNVLFFCKIYIATLITILMQNVLNGGEKRVVYVEVGEDNNGAQAVNQVVKDIKSREIGSIMGMDLQTILNIQGQYQDYFIPVVDGEKPISFETIDSLSNKSIDDDFLNWLGGQIFSGMGMPTAYLNEVENIDFAKLLSMQNSRYLREVLSEQNVLSPGYTELLRKLYTIEYGDINNDKIKKKQNTTRKKKGETTVSQELEMTLDDIINPSMIEVKLPTPAALALITINDQLSNASSIMDTIVENSDLDSRPGITEEDVEALKKRVKRELLREFVPSMAWPKVDGIIDQAVKDYTEDKIKKTIKNSDAEEVASTETEDETSSSGAEEEPSDDFSM